LIQLIGDIHGNVQKAIYLLTQRSLNTEHVFFLGDIGFGFPEFDKKKFYEILTHHQRTSFYLIQGNHDNADEMEDFSNVMVVSSHTGAKVINLFDNDFLLIPGALSVDRKQRIEGLSWWANEQMSSVQYERTIEQAVNANYILSHDAPLRSYFGFFHNTEVSISNRALDVILEENMYNRIAKRWFHGHLHKNYQANFGSILVNGLANDTDLNVEI